MANALTGEFDVVAGFSTHAVDRLLAAMHRSERFPHSLTLRVDDDPPPGPKVDRPTVVASVDAFGDPTVNHDRIGMPIPVPGQLVASDPAYSVLDPLVNAGELVATEGPIIPSRLRGRAQLQVSTPTIEVTDASGSKVTVRMEIKARYFPDPQTSPLAEFIVGELRMTAAVDQVASQAADVIEVDVKADQVVIDFRPTWSSNPLSAADVAAINLAIRNALKTSFLPASATLPSNIRYLQGKTVLGSASAICLLLNMGHTRGNPGSFGSSFLAGADDFGFAVGADYVRSVFQPTLDKILSQPIAPITIGVSVFVHTFHVTYTISLGSASVDLQNGAIVLTLKGHAHTGTSWMPDFDFTVTQILTLAVDGDTADLIVGAISLDASSWLVNLFRDSATSGMISVRDHALAQSGAFATVRRMLSADANLGGFIRSLLVSPHPKPGVRPPPDPLGLQLAYTGVEIRPAGIVLHGSLAVMNWPVADVEFQEIPSTGAGAGSGAIFHGPDYSALKTWIPGGKITQYEWFWQGRAQPFLTDTRRFVLIHQLTGTTDAGAFGSLASEASVGGASTGTVPGFVPLCLTVRGTRITSSGPAVSQPVSASACGVHTVSVVPTGFASTAAGAFPLVALTQPGPGGLIAVTGHASALLDEAPRGAPNLLVHFADDKSAARLDILAQAVRECARRDAPTAILAVLSSEQLVKAHYTNGVIYAEDQRSWGRVYGVGAARVPATLIVGPDGKVRWRHEGEIERAALTAALRTHLVAGGAVIPRLLRTNLRLAHAAPNFLFELSPGKSQTLRKLAGRALTLVFWKIASKPSIEAVRDFRRTAAGAVEHAVLAINDGDPAEAARRVAADNKLTATIVTDPRREISLAYRVNIWPTIVSLGASGSVENIRYGRPNSKE
jgi:peroxiredoxin